MSEIVSKKLLAIVGPTGAGKSRFAIEIAHLIKGEIVSCDSMAVYKGVNIVTDKVPIEERENIPHQKNGFGYYRRHNSAK